LWEFDSLIPNQENRSLNWLRYFRGIAQLVARLVRDEEAVGSNPAAPTKKNQYTFVYWFFFVSVRDLNRAAVRSTANKAILWLCLARGFHRLGMSNRVHAANTFVYWFFFVSVRDLSRAAVQSTANKAIVWLCLARGSQPVGMSNKVHAANTFVYWFFFVSVRDLNRVAVRSIANKAIVWLCLARGSHRLGMSNKVHPARSSGVCNPQNFDLCSKYDILEEQSHIWLQNGQKSEEKQKLCRKQKRKNGRSRFL
jgi:hypothetical protein